MSAITDADATAVEDETGGTDAPGTTSSGSDVVEQDLPDDEDLDAVVPSPS
jgi:hypothetical protein